MRQGESLVNVKSIEKKRDEMCDLVHTPDNIGMPIIRLQHDVSRLKSNLSTIYLIVTVLMCCRIVLSSYVQSYWSTDDRLGKDVMKFVIQLRKSIAPRFQTILNINNKILQSIGNFQNSLEDLESNCSIFFGKMCEGVTSRTISSNLSIHLNEMVLDDSSIIFINLNSCSDLIPEHIGAEWSLMFCSRSRSLSSTMSEIKYAFKWSTTSSM